MKIPKLSQCSYNLLVSFISIILITNDYVALFCDYNKSFNNNFFSALHLTFDILVSICYIFLILNIASTIRYFYIVISILLFPLAILYSYFHSKIGILINSFTMQNIYDNIGNSEFVFSLLSTKVILSMSIIFLLIIYFSTTYLNHVLKIPLKNKLKIIMFSAFLLFSTCSVKYILIKTTKINLYNNFHKLKLANFMMIPRYITSSNPIISIYNGVTIIPSLITAELPESDLAYENATTVKVTHGKNTNQNLKIILMIGESARAANWSMNGYHRDTNKYTKNIKNLINFKQVRSCDTSTTPSVNCMLSSISESESNSALTTQPFLFMLTKDFYKNTIITTSHQYTVYRNAKKSIQESGTDFRIIESKCPANITACNSSVDEILLEHLNLSLLPNERQFIILHGNGSHDPFHNRYPSNFEVFKPTSQKTTHESSYEENINAYDNSILYTDFVISKIINRIKDENVLFIYVSDHGQYLNEDGLFMHGQPKNLKSGMDDRIRRVPMFIYASDKFIHSYPKYWRAIQKHKNEHISHDNIFHTILGCGSLESDIINQQLNLCAN